MVTAELFDFLGELQQNNQRAWFESQRERYAQQVKTPIIALIRQLQAPLAEWSPQLVADPRGNGGSMFRIHRDRRFSADKTPYKTHVGIRLFHASTQRSARGAPGSAAPGRLDAPLLYLHLAPDRCFAGAGIWHPQPETLRRLRAALISLPASWIQATRNPEFEACFRLEGEVAQRVPRGFPATHPLADDLRRKDFIAVRTLQRADFCRPDSAEHLLRQLWPAAALVDWLCGALDLEY